MNNLAVKIRAFLGRKRAFLKRSILFLAAVLMITGCTRQLVVTTYYLLDYLPTAKTKRLQLKEPLPFRAQVRNFKIPRSFDSIRIVARFSSHQINYYRYSLWAVRPQIAIADLLAQHINAYHIFQDCQREFLDKIPDYEITGEIYQIELYDSEQFAAAHLKMVIELHDRSQNKLIVKHDFDREHQIPKENMTVFAKALSDIINEETEIFLAKVVDHFYPPEIDSLEVNQ